VADGSKASSNNDLRITVAAAVAIGEIWQTPDGWAGWYAADEAAASGERRPFIRGMQLTCPKIAAKVCLDGGPAYWDHANNQVTPLPPLSGRGFLLGSFIGDAAAADTTCNVNLGIEPRYAIRLRDGFWTQEAINGVGHQMLLAGVPKLEFDAVVEAAQIAFYSERTIPTVGNAILRARIVIQNQGDNAALDFDLGLASGSHATDFETIAEFASIHFDGNSLALLVQSDDGTTDVAPTATGVNAVAGTPFEAWIDTRDPASVKFYLDGVRVAAGTTFRLDQGAGPLKAIALLEKTSDDTVADVRILDLDVRTAEQ
jgi:hypothetical protein